MTTFFVAGVDSRGARAEDAYLELRERSRIVAGCPAKPRRIFKLSCRFHGSDCEVEVGMPMSGSSDVVVAILDHGREEPYVVHTDRGKVGAEERISRPVYSVTEFK